MFFFIGGVQPKTVTLDGSKRICPACGLAQAYLKRVDHYLSLFFIPIFPLKRGSPVLICDRCGSVSSPDQPLRQPTPQSAAQRDHCAKCGYPLKPEFKYCPNCGASI
jgi:RNA polymerase subunit RPABC4/transcription elongation factor Spt4